MKLIFITWTCLLISLQGWAQYRGSSRPKNHTINLNDTSYLRIFNGIIIKNNEVINHFDRVNYIRDRQSLADLEMDADTPVMLIETDKSKIESEIDSILYSRKDFIESYPYPLSIRLPVSINGKLLMGKEKAAVLSKLKISAVKQVNYLGSEQSMVKYRVTPFGVIDLQVSRSY